MRINWGPASFAGTHRWDRNFFLLMVGLVWLGILMGFVPEIVHRLETHARPYPLVVHVHAVAFVTWLCLLTVQVWLIRTRRTNVHRKLGVAGMVLYPVMIVLGLSAAIVVNRESAGTPDFDPSFISVQFADMLNFTVLASAAFWLRRVPSAHKRFIILATIFIADAGYGRWWDGPILHWFTEHLGASGFWANATGLFLGDFLLVIVLGCYDLVTRRRLHPAFVYGASFGLLVEALGGWLYVSPWWKPVAMRLLGL